MSGRRSNTGVTNFLSDLVDDIKDFLDDEVLDRGRDTERDLRRTGRNWTDSDDDRGGRSRSAAGRDLEELKRTIRALSRKIEALEDAGSGSSAGAELPIAGYDDLTAVEVNNRLGSLSQADLITVDRYERAHADRSTVTGRIEALRGSEPWSGYDEQTVVDIRKALSSADEATVAEVRKYEAGHKNRQGVLDATQAN